jgi:hypothetical protein
MDLFVCMGGRTRYPKAALDFFHAGNFRQSSRNKKVPTTRHSKRQTPDSLLRRCPFHDVPLSLMPSMGVVVLMITHSFQQRLFRVSVDCFGPGNKCAAFAKIGNARRIEK